MSKQQKRYARMILFAFLFGVGGVFGFIVSEFTLLHILVGFFALVGVCVLAVLMYAVVTDETTEQEETRSYPANWGFDKKFEE